MPRVLPRPCASLGRGSMQPDSKKSLRTKEAGAQREDPGSFHAYKLLQFSRRPFVGDSLYRGSIPLNKIRANLDASIVCSHAYSVR